MWPIKSNQLQVTLATPPCCASQGPGSCALAPGCTQALRVYVHMNGHACNTMVPLLECIASRSGSGHAGQQLAFRKQHPSHVPPPPNSTRNPPLACKQPEAAAVTLLPALTPYSCCLPARASSRTTSSLPSSRAMAMAVSPWRGVGVGWWWALSMCAPVRACLCVCACLCVRVCARTYAWGWGGRSFCLRLAVRAKGRGGGGERQGGTGSTCRPGNRRTCMRVQYTAQASQAPAVSPAALPGAL